MSLDYKANVANHIAKEIYRSHGAGTIEDAYELSHRSGAELMRSKYCVRYELGLCQLHPDPTRASRHGISAQPPKGPLYLLNNGRRLRLDFDCSACEMSVSAASPANASD
jgi:putative protease